MVSHVVRLTFLGALLCIVVPLRVTAQQRPCIPAPEIEQLPNQVRVVPPNEITGWVMWYIPLPVAPPECGRYRPGLASKGDCTKTRDDRAAIRAYLSVTREFIASLPFPRFPRGVVLIFENEDTGTCWEVTQKDFGFSVQIPAGVYGITIDHPPFHRLEARVRTFDKPTKSPDGKYFHYEVLEGLKPPGQTMGVFPRDPDPGETWESVLRSPYVHRLNFALQLHSNNESMTVRGLLTDGSLGSSFSGARLDAPLTSARTFQSLLPLVPGAVVTEQVGSQAQFTAVGQRRFSNRLSIDGVSADLGIDVATLGLGVADSESLPALATSGGIETLIPADAIEEIRVRTSNASPQHAQAPGAQTTIVTRAGGDKLAGSLFLDGRLRELGAGDQFHPGTRPPASKNFGGALGGPLRRGRAQYFVASEGQRIDRPLLATAEVPSLSLRETAAPALRAVLEAFPTPNGPELGAGLAELRREFPVRSSLGVLSVRVDGSISARHRAFARVSAGRSRGTALSAPRFALHPDFSFEREESTSTRAATVGAMSSTRSGRWSTDVRMNATLHRGGVIAGASPIGGAPLNGSGLIPTGVPRDSLVSLTLFPGPAGTIRSGTIADDFQEQFQAVGLLTYTRGRHEVRVGVDVARVTAAAAGGHRYTYGFAPDLQLSQLTIDQIAPARVLFETFSAFVQDGWRVSERLTVNVGARYSIKPAPISRTGISPLLIAYESLPQLRPRENGGPRWATSRLDFAPQVGAAYQLPKRAGKETTIRAGWNLTHDELTSPGGAVFGRGAPYVTSRGMRPSAFPVLAGELVDTGQGVTRTEYFSFPESLRRPRTYGWHASVDQGLGRMQRVSLSYVGAAGRDLPYWFGFNTSGLVPINAYSNDGRSAYHALLSEYVRRFTGGIEARAAYTWSHAIDNDSGESITPHLPPAVSSPASERGSADFDRRHVLALTGTYRLSSPPGLPRVLRAIAVSWQVDAAVVARSGAPFSVTVPRVFGGGVYTVRTDDAEAAAWVKDSASPTGRRLDPLAFPLSPEPRQGTRGRNTLRAAPLMQMDLSLSRAFRVGRRITASVRAEAFNLLGVVNTGPPESRLLQPGLGVPFQSAAEALGTGTLSGGGLVPLQQAGGPRSVRLGVRLGW